MAITDDYMPKSKEELAQYQREYRKNNREMVSRKVSEKRQKRSEWAINFLGGKCANCNGVFDPVCYDYHHKNPDEKEFTIGENSLIGWERFKKEIEKCILLCANCHRLEHKVAK